jgi:hypothetical protein
VEGEAMLMLMREEVPNVAQGCDVGTTVKRRDSARRDYRDISQFGSTRFKKSKHMLYVSE